MVDWLNFNQLSGSGDTEVTVTASTYSELVDRSTIVTVSGMSKSVEVGVYQEAWHNPYEDEYLTIESLSDGFLQLPKMMKYSSGGGRVWYKRNDSNWVENSTGGTIYVRTGDLIKVKGDGYFVNPNVSFGGSATTITYNVYGNIMSMVWGDDFVGKDYFPQISQDYPQVFIYMFWNTNVIDASNLSLPAVTLSTGCYYGMFSRTTLKYAPRILPAPIATSNCYAHMFYNCSGLLTAPHIMAEVMGYYSCEWMFHSCRSLVTPPALPATLLGEGSYANMFDGCNSLQTTPVLPSSVVPDYGYQNMFIWCTALTTVQAISATTVGVSSCGDMFTNCVSLTTAPQLQVTALSTNSLIRMFGNCVNLVNPPNLPATTLKRSCYEDMFEGCTSLTIAPNLPATTLATECYQGMFEGCTSLTTVVLPAQTLVTDCYHTMFVDCTSLNHVTCLATNPNGNNYTYGWLDNVASAGTFVKASGVSGWSTDDNGIPVGWTVQEI